MAGEPDAIVEDDAAGGGTTAVLELDSVTKEYETGGEVVRALDDVDFAVEGGDSVAVIGPSGSGKSTMLNLLGLLDAPTDGVVRLDGDDVTDLTERERTDARKAFLGFVFQDFFLIPTLTAKENVEVPTMFDRQDSGDRAEELLERVGLAGRIDHYPNELSGGQKQRVAIARALINEPEVVLADEPTGNLDRETGEQILGEFERVRERGVSVVFVTHDPLVTEYAGRTVELVDGRVASETERRQP
jgi:putative ABC transport system ATP-binding protein